MVTHYHAPISKKNTFLKSKYNQEIDKKAKYGFFREEVISDIIINLKSKKNYIICTTGMASRELYEARVRNKQNLFKDFLTVGGMGHVSQIASGIALSKKKKIM